MRNLRNVHHSRLLLKGEKPVAATAWDVSTQSIIVATEPSNTSEVIELQRYPAHAISEEQGTLIASWDAPCPHPDLEHDAIIHLHYFSHTRSSCLVLAGGDIVVVRSNPLPGEEKIEIVGSVDAGITAAAWSPDEEILAVSTRAATLLYMTAEFDAIASTTFSADDSKLSKQVSVGWGKAETQFKGKRAKAMRDPTIPEQVDQGDLSPFDDGRVSISWRGDGAYVAVNSIEDRRRMIRVYDREGVLDSVTEAVNGLESALSWRPQGNLIAGLQRLSGQLKVIFFERNGLRHGEFPIRLASEEASTWGQNIKLHWNVDSTVLAVSFVDKVQLWTMGNYHYYLKQEIHMGDVSSNNHAAVISWHPEEALRLLLHPSLSKDTEASSKSTPDKIAKSVHILRFVFNVAGGSIVPPYDIGNVAVIDGKLLRLTPLGIANVPPPMALHEILLDENAIDVAINSDNSQVAVLHEASISVFECSTKSAFALEPSMIERLPIRSRPFSVAQQICFNGIDDIHVLFSNFASGKSEIRSLISGKSALFTSEQAIQLFPSADYKHLCIASDSTVSQLHILSQHLPDVQIPAHAICSVSPPIPHAQVVQYNEEAIAVALSPMGALYVNERLLVKNCTSFQITQSHIILTTATHLLKFIHLADIENLEVPPDEPETDERCRSIERGAKLVSVMPSVSAVVLQMPRGNLETIYPRALVLAEIRRKIHARDYKSAFRVCRAQRVNMNILHDHSPHAFFENAELIVKQLAKVEHIDLFLSQLSEENVAETMYRETLPKFAAVDETKQMGSNSENAESLSGPAKVNKICEAFLVVLKKDHAKSMQSIITANLCKSPPDIESGLQIINGIPEAEPDRIEAAVEHICFLADVNEIYSRALGIYNLRLTLLVAQQSQKDPREYLPYLQELQIMPELRRKFAIDDDLRRHSKALEHLHALNDFEGVRGYIQKHSLYTQGLELYRYAEQQKADVLRLYASHLLGANKFHAAAIALESLHDYRGAMDAYRSATLWQECLSCANMIPLDAEETASLANDLIEGLVESKEYSAAAEIYRDYLSDVEAATKYFCKAYAFADATSLVARTGKTELLASTIDIGLAEGAAALTELLADCRNQLVAQVPRLRELRVKKREDPLAFYEGAAPEDVPDNISLAPSNTSTTGNTFMTRYTGASGTGTLASGTSRRTSKNRRREERKRARGKKGSIYEEEYLVNSIGRLFERVQSVEDDVRRTVDACLRRSMRERAQAVQQAMLEVTEACQAVVPEVWEVQQTQQQQQTQADENGVERPQGPDGVLWDSMEEKKRRVPPTVRPYQGSLLLDIKQ